MSYLEFSIDKITHDDAALIADAYFRADKDPAKMARLMGAKSFDLNLLVHPLVKAKIVALKNELNQIYTLEEHLESLKDIRNTAKENENLKIALSAEIALGRAAGLYEPKSLKEDPKDGKDVKKLGTDELRKRLLASKAPAALSHTPSLDEAPETEF